MKLAFAILAACATFVGDSAAQNTRLIGLNVQVIDSHTGESAELLGPHDFEVYDDGQRVPIRNLDIDTPPMDLAFLIYISNPGLTTPVVRRRYIQGLEAAAEALRPEDRAGVVRGPGTHGVSLPLIADKAAIARALLHGERQTDKYRLFDAVASALSLFSEQTSFARRRTIIAITDDIERNSAEKADSLQEDLLRDDVALDEVVLAFARGGSRINSGSPKLPFPRITGSIGTDSVGGSSLMSLVRATGGESMIGDDFDSVLPALIQRLRLRYTLTVAVQDGARAFHKIEVKLTPEKRSQYPGVTIRARIGYYSEP